MQELEKEQRQLEECREKMKVEADELKEQRFVSLVHSLHTYVSQRRSIKIHACVL